MKKKNRKTIVFIGVCAIIALFVIYAFLFNDSNSDKTETLVYFLNPVTNNLEAETFYLGATEGGQKAQEVLDILSGGPKSKNLVKTFPDYVKFVDGRLVIKDKPDNNSLELEFSKEYEKMTPFEEQFFRAALVYSMTELPFIQDVLFYVDGKELLRTDGKPVGVMNTKNFVINPVISPEKLRSVQVVLYFFDVESKKLLPENRSINVNPDLPIEKYVLEQLIQGPETKSLSATMPVETKIIGDVKTEDGICYINLSNDYLSKNNAVGTVLECNLFSIVNSLTELSGVTKVQFLFEGEKTDSFKGFIDLSKPLGRNEDYILKE